MADEAVEELAEPIDGQGAEIVAPPGFLRALGFNLLAGLESLVFRRTVATRVSGSVPQVLALVLIGIAAAFANDFWQTGPDGAPNPEGLAGLLFGQPFLLLSAWAVARLARAEGRVLAGVVVLEALWLPLDLIVIGFTYLPEPLWNRIGGPLNLPFWTVYAWGMVASCVALIRVTGLEARRAWAAALAIGVFLLLPTMFVNPERRLWLPPQYLDEDEASSKARASESVLYGEQDLLEDTLDAIQPGRPGLPGFFLVALGGTGSQDVFMREVTEVQSLFDSRFDTKGRSVVLLNNPATLSRYPIASMTALRRTLEVVGERMNRDEDVLVLFMTSHGAQDFRFELELEPWALEPISPENLREALDDAGIRNRVLIVSACYSGGFIEPLAGPDTLVMTASRADRNSHGCSHEADWTFFGRAMFAEALEHTHSFEQAFAVASRRIAERETAEGLVHSEPRIAVGEHIRKRLAAIEKRLDG